MNYDLIRRLTLPLLLALAAMPALADAPVVVRTPHGGRVPEVVFDSRGVWHLTYGLEGDGYYAASRDGGKTFAEAVKLNRRAGTVTVGGERGPKLALGKDGSIHAVWLGHYQKGGGVWYARSTDGGRTFEPERNIQDAQAGSDSPTVIADSENVLIFWLDARTGKDENSPTAHPILMARSTDDGATFAKNEIVKHDHPGLACACCRLEARLGAGGHVYLAFRSGYQSIRDFYLLRGRKGENNFKSVRVSADNWKLDGCPMSGAAFGVSRDGRVLISWMSQGKVYWSSSDKGATNFAPRAAVPAGEGAANFPIALADGGGGVLVVWKQGTQLNWARYRAGGEFTGERGTLGEAAGKDKFTAFVGAGGKIYVVVSG
jgi:hypothetical protein